MLNMPNSSTVNTFNDFLYPPPLPNKTKLIKSSGIDKCFDTDTCSILMASALFACLHEIRDG